MLNKKLQEIVNVYNDKQDEWYIIRFDKECEIHISIPDETSVVKYRDIGSEWIGLYEWLFNPKYRVLEVFKIVMTSSILTFDIDLNFKIKQPEEIIDYIYSETTK